MRKRFALCGVTKLLLLLLFWLMIPIISTTPYRPFNNLTQPDMTQHGMEVIRRSVAMMQSVGSRLPDCSHACGSCMPCRLVIVASACASLTEAESCPISYRCMCNNKTYPVP